MIKMNNFTTESPFLENNNDSPSNNTSNNTSSSNNNNNDNTSSNPCLPSTSNFTFSTVENILKIYPSVMKNVLTTYNIKNCSLKNGYCSQTIKNSSGCLENTPDPLDTQCSCDCLLFPLNLMNSLNNTIYCTITNTSTTNYVLSDQTIVFSLQNTGSNISHATINTSQTASVKCVSLSSTSVQKNIADLSYNVITNIIQQAKTQPSLFSCPISQDFLKMYEAYGKDDLNNIVQSSVKASISSFIIDSQTISISLSDVDFKQLKANISQDEALTILTNNIVNQSFNKINQSVLGQHFDDIMSSFNSYCFPPPTTQPPPEIVETDPPISPLTIQSTPIETTTTTNAPTNSLQTWQIILIGIGAFIVLCLFAYGCYNLLNGNQG